ncbi:serine/threonine protein phosphatase [Mycoplasmoides genitalium M2321]|nr:serine/threonine protein phosphatase [Mycoplasmoides genitalium M2321]AFQ03524.1 serine/threonine protein phosphatase [Mycoplasmoides genitalium M6282]
MQNKLIKVLVIADTHGQNQRWIELKNYHNPDVIIHAGDHMTTKQFMDQNATFWVAGNNDSIGNEIEIFQLGQINFVLMHGHQAPRDNLKKWYQLLVLKAQQYPCDVLIFGHSHIEYTNKINKIQLINPGSLQLPRNQTNTPSYCTFIVNKDELTDLTIHYYQASKVS